MRQTPNLDHSLITALLLTGVFGMATLFASFPTPDDRTYAQRTVFKLLAVTAALSGVALLVTAIMEIWVS